jgi:hypothetical protein
VRARIAAGRGVNVKASDLGTGEVAVDPFGENAAAGELTDERVSQFPGNCAWDR